MMAPVDMDNVELRYLISFLLYMGQNTFVVAYCNTVPTTIFLLNICTTWYCLFSVYGGGRDFFIESL